MARAAAFTRLRPASSSTTTASRPVAVPLPPRAVNSSKLCVFLFLEYDFPLIWVVVPVKKSHKYGFVWLNLQSMDEFYTKKWRLVSKHFTSKINEKMVEKTPNVIQPYFSCFSFNHPS